MAKKIWQSADLTIEEVEAGCCVSNDGIAHTLEERGFLVTQGNEKYFARKWLLTSQVIEFVDMCINSGLTCVIRKGHPRPESKFPKGIPYIHFSRNPEERFICGIDEYSPRPKNYESKFGRTIFNKKYKEVLTNANIGWYEQSAAAKNLHVPYEQVQQAINACLRK